ncbi:MAG: hypothetical protein CMK09_17265 [Ponticaulis sp.]|nr:hypothetical protein [Ponticaulis sp.]|tara:strand:- start:34745 stop:35023 length:279 start_codon:yes stop_codon:yes gene_type:complete
MKFASLSIAPPLGLTALASCAHPAAGVRTACVNDQAIRAEVVAIQADSVVVVGPDGQFNVSKAYLTEMPRIGDFLHISPTNQNGECVYTPAY